MVAAPFLMMWYRLSATQRQDYDADGHRDNLFDDHEDNHRQEIAVKY